LFSTLLGYYADYLNNDKPIAWFGTFSIEGLSLKELNELGRERK